MTLNVPTETGNLFAMKQRRNLSRITALSVRGGPLSHRAMPPL